MFVALVPTDEVIEHLADVVSPQQEPRTAFRWSPAQWHVTLACMAEVRARHLDDQAARLERPWT